MNISLRDFLPKKKRIHFQRMLVFQFCSILYHGNDLRSHLELLFRHMVRKSWFGPTALEKDNTVLLQDISIHIMKWYPLIRDQRASRSSRVRSMMTLLSLMLLIRLEINSFHCFEIKMPVASVNSVRQRIETSFLFSITWGW